MKQLRRYLNESISQKRRTVRDEIERLYENLEVDEFIIVEDGTELARFNYDKVDLEYENRKVFDIEFTDNGSAILKI